MKGAFADAAAFAAASDEATQLLDDFVNSRTKDGRWIFALAELTPDAVGSS